LRLNPNGHIPVVVDQRAEAEGGEVVIWESMACALYVARHHGPADGQSITPANAKEDAEALRWSYWAVTEAEADALTVLMHRMVMAPERRKPELAQVAERRLAVPFRVIEQHLVAQKQRGADYLAASRFTVADLCVASVLNWARPARDLMAAHPLAHAWIVRCIERPAHVAVKSIASKP
jgi:glutathione S-transferase